MKNTAHSRFGTYALAIVNCLICLFLLAPILVVIVTSFSADQYMRFPPSGWSLRWYTAFVEDDNLMNGLLLSAVLAVTTAVISGAIGTLAAFSLTRSETKTKEVLRLLHTAPLITPGVVVGLSMLIFFTTIGLRGSFLTLLFGHVVLSIPFVVIIVMSGLQSYDRSLEDAAQSLGANKFIAFTTITIPVIKTSAISAAAFAFLHSFDEVIVTLLLPGPRTKTLPVTMFEYIQYNLDPLPAAVSTVLIALTVLLVFSGVKLGVIKRLMHEKN